MAMVGVLGRTASIEQCGVGRISLAYLGIGCVLCPFLFFGPKISLIWQEKL